MSGTADMIAELSLMERRLLDEFQHDFPLVPHPYAAIAKRLGMDQRTVLHAYRRFMEAGLIARIGAVCDLDGDITGGCIDAITTSTRGLESFSAQLDTHLGGTLVAPTEWFGRLLWSLHEAGATVALPTCADCGVTAKKLRRTEHGPQCSSCYAEAHKRPCSRCGTGSRRAGTTGRTHRCRTRRCAC